MKNILLFLLFPFVSIAQVAQNEMNINVFGNPFHTANQSYIRILNATNNIESNSKYFVYKDWTAMQAKSADGGFIEVDSSNLFIPESKIIFYNNGEMFNVFPDRTETVVIGEDLYRAYRSDDKIGNSYEFYQILCDGDLKLMKGFSAVEKEITQNPMGISDSGKTKIVQKATLYYLSEKGEITLLPKKKRDIIDVFRRKKSKMISFASENNISHRSETDLVALFEHYNTLMSETN